MAAWWLRLSPDERWCAALLLLLLVLLALVYAVWLANADVLAAVHTRPEMFGLLKAGGAHAGDEGGGGGGGSGDRDGPDAGAPPAPASQRGTPKKTR